LPGDVSASDEKLICAASRKLDSHEHGGIPSITDAIFQIDRNQDRQTFSFELCLPRDTSHAKPHARRKRISFQCVPVAKIRTQMDHGPTQVPGPANQRLETDARISGIRGCLDSPLGTLASATEPELKILGIQADMEALPPGMGNREDSEMTPVRQGSDDITINICRIL
jgi:hypothetical protein